MPEVTAIPAVRDVPAADLKPGMRVQVGAPWIWQPPVSSVKTWGPGEDESQSYPETWWTRVTMQSADRSHVDRYYTPSSPVRVVEEVGCRECGTLVPVAEAVTGREYDRTLRPPRLVEQYDLCPVCAVAPDGEPARPVGLDDDAVIDALSAVSSRRALLDTLNPTKEA